MAEICPSSDDEASDLVDTSSLEKLVGGVLSEFDISGETEKIVSVMNELYGVAREIIIRHYRS